MPSEELCVAYRLPGSVTEGRGGGWTFCGQLDIKSSIPPLSTFFIQRSTIWTSFADIEEYIGPSEKFLTETSRADWEQTMSEKSQNSLENASENTNEKLLEDSALCRLAKAAFRQVTPPQYGRKEPRQPLLKSTPDEERNTVIKLWRVMAQFCDVTSEYSLGQKHDGHDKLCPVMARLRKQFATSKKESEATSNLDIESIFASNEDSVTTKPNKPRSKKFNTMRATMTRKLFPNRDQELPESLPLEYFLITPLDQVHYIIGCGILKPKIRDEIYCQICKHLTKNPHSSGVTRCWVLLGLVLSCFPPSAQILETITEFIKDAADHMTSHMKQLLTGSLKNGPRCQPPSFLELESALKKKTVQLQVTLMDGTVQTIPADGTTTSRDVCDRLSESLGLRQKSGYSLYISLVNKVASLGSGKSHVMDAISQSEQMFHEQEGGDGHAPWRLFYRKEMFAPWDDFSSDMMAVHLICAQVTRGVVLGEYTCRLNADLAVMVARQLYIEYGPDIKNDVLHSALPSLIPPNYRKNGDSLNTWRCLVLKKYKKMFDTKKDKKPTVEQVKSDIVKYAKTNWAMSFSGYYDVTKLEGPFWNNMDSLTLAVNSTGVYVMSPERRTLMEISFPEIISIRGKADKDEDDVILFVLADGSLIKFQSRDAVDIRHIVCNVMLELRKRSMWAVVREDASDAVPDHIEVKENDLIHLNQTAARGALKHGFCQGTNCRTGKTGRIWSKSLYIVPSITKPSHAILKVLQGPTNRCSMNDGFEEMEQALPNREVMMNGYGSGPPTQ